MVKELKFVVRDWAKMKHHTHAWYFQGTDQMDALMNGVFDLMFELSPAWEKGKKGHQQAMKRFIRSVRWFMNRLEEDLEKVEGEGK